MEHLIKHGMIWGFSHIFGNTHINTYPRDPGSPKLRMVSWNLNTMRFVEVIGHPNQHLRICRLMPRDIEEI